jgi:hypothetical protein
VSDDDAPHDAAADAPPADAVALDADDASLDGDAALAPDYRDIALAAIEYLDDTTDELGADVVASLMIYGDLKDEPRALEVAAGLRARLPSSELERYPGLLDAPVPAFSPSTLEGVTPSATTPDPFDDLGDDRASRCLEETFGCAFSDPCLDFVREDDRWGYVLTHQAVWLLFAELNECEAGIDVEERRHTFAANLVAAMRADPRASDLSYERLALLGHLGFASEVDPAWLELIVVAQTDEGCLPLRRGEPCHPHPTGVAVWALAHH